MFIHTGQQMRGDVKSEPVSVPSMVMALIGIMAAAIENVPPSSPVTTTLPPRASSPVANCSDRSEPTKSQAANTPPVDARIALRASGSAGS